MTYTAPGAVAASLPYIVLEVAGCAPQSLERFLGETEFVIDNAKALSKVFGRGAYRGHDVRFQEKDSSGNGKDTRAWTVNVSADGQFTAAVASQY